MALICFLLQAYLIILLVTAVLSWFPVEPGTTLERVNGVLRNLVDPVLNPLRQVIPPIGMFDISFLVLVLGLSLLLSFVC
ncbi:MAG: YggT family protein [Acidimicrobiia bacterium]